jgi:hypothetical protein
MPSGDIVEPVNEPGQDLSEGNVEHNDNQHLRHSNRISKRHQRLIESHMLTAHGTDSTHLLLYNSNNHKSAMYLKSQSELTVMSNIMMAQYGMRKGLKHFSQRGIDANIT